MRPVYGLLIRAASIAAMILFTPSATRSENLSYHVQSVAKNGDRVNEGSPDAFRIFDPRCRGLGTDGQVSLSAVNYDIARGDLLILSDSGKLKLIAKPGDRVGNVSVSPLLEQVAGPNDQGQVTFSTGEGWGARKNQLFQWSDGKLIAIVAAGKDVPGKRAGEGARIVSLTMNQRGDIAFAAGPSNEAVTGTSTDIYRWDYQKQQVIPIAVEGMPAADDWTFRSHWFYLYSSDFPTAKSVINIANEIAFVASGSRRGDGYFSSGLFFLNRYGRIQPVALSGQDIPSVGKIYEACCPSINDSGVVSFLASYGGNFYQSAFIWENDKIIPVALAGENLHGAGKLGSVGAVWTNNRNRNVLVEARLEYLLGPSFAPRALYLFAHGQLNPVAVPGQDMPGGGKLGSHGIGYYANNSPAVSEANSADQHVFIADLQDGTDAVYQVDVDGKLSLVLREGMTTDVGTIGAIRWWDTQALINNRGQVALTVDVDGQGSMVVLLTPTMR
jgi:hypothetical protein